MPARNESLRLSATIQSIANTRSNNFSLEIIVVDDASSDDSCANLDCDSPNLRLKVLSLKERVGVPQARNLGAQLAAGDILFMTDAHVSFCQDWDNFIMKRITENCIIAATICNPCTFSNRYGCSLLLPFMGTQWNKNLDGQSTPYVQIAAAGGTILKNKLFKKIGGYDSGMILYGSAEPEFSVRAWLMGAEIVSVPELKVNHIYKTKAALDKFVRSMRPFLTHNSLRFGLLYLDELAIFQMIRFYSLYDPKHIQEAFKLILKSDVWKRRAFLEKKLEHDFYWFVNRFNLRDISDQEIL